MFYGGCLYIFPALGGRLKTRFVSSSVDLGFSLVFRLEIGTLGCEDGLHISVIC